MFIPYYTDTTQEMTSPLYLQGTAFLYNISWIRIQDSIILTLCQYENGRDFYYLGFLPKAKLFAGWE